VTIPSVPSAPMKLSGAKCKSAETWERVKGLNAQLRRVPSSGRFPCPLARLDDLTARKYYGLRGQEHRLTLVSESRSERAGSCAEAEIRRTKFRNHSARAVPYRTAFVPEHLTVDEVTWISMTGAEGGGRAALTP
jgi:hypothetical protein